MVAGRVLAAAEDRIVEHQGQRGERPVDAVHEARCGVVLGEDLPDVVRARLVNARVPVDAEGVVQREARLEGVGVHQGSEGAEGEEGKEMGAPAERRPEPGRRRARRLRRRGNRTPRAASTLRAHRGQSAGASTIGLARRKAAARPRLPLAARLRTDSGTRWRAPARTDLIEDARVWRWEPAARLQRRGDEPGRLALASGACFAQYGGLIERPAAMRTLKAGVLYSALVF